MSSEKNMIGINWIQKSTLDADVVQFRKGQDLLGQRRQTIVPDVEIRQFDQVDDLFGDADDLVVGDVQPDERGELHQVVDLVEVAAAQFEILEFLERGDVGDVEEVVVGGNIDFNQVGHVTDLRIVIGGQ